MRSSAIRVASGPSGRWYLVPAVLLWFLTTLVAPAAIAQSIESDVPDVVLTGVPFSVTVKADGIADGTPVTVSAGSATFEGEIQKGEAVIEEIVHEGGDGGVRVEAAGSTTEATPVTLPGWVSILPALMAILIALVFRQVIPALFLGVWLGATLVYGASVTGVWTGLLDSFTVYTLNALNDSGHLSIILFSLMIGGMVGIISKNGGTAGIVNAIIGWASTSRRGQSTTAALGCAIFFDDYANTLIVGNTMRPITDRLKISREKLAYLVDSTAAPIATVALVTTWIGFQLGLIGSAAEKLEGLDQSAYSIFLNSLAYNFYPFLAIGFVFLIAFSGRDFGPMLAAERRARRHGRVQRADADSGGSDAENAMREPKADEPKRALNAVIPILVLVLGSLIGIYVTGRQGVEGEPTLRAVIGAGDSYTAMMWASLLSCLVAGGLSLGQRILTLEETVDAWYAGIKTMLLAVIILVLAWSLSNVNDALHTADYLVSTLGESVDPALLPAIVFVLAALTAFATGSSWGVMGVLMPLAIPLGWAVVSGGGSVDAAGFAIFYATVASVLAGAVWGDHCSPISDTTILSSLASECDHIDHVRTQIPYALTVGLVAIGAGSLPVAYGYYPWWGGLLIGAGLLSAALFIIGRDAEAGVDSSAEGDATNVADDETTTTSTSGNARPARQATVAETTD